MEVLGVAAGVARLINLFGQCIGGAEKLVDFCQEIRRSSWHVDELIGDVKAITAALSQGKDLAEQLQKNPNIVGVQGYLVSLREHLKDLNDAIADWLKSVISTIRA